MTKLNHTAAYCGLHVGARVRVRTGVADPDYPDMPLGGWTGLILRIENRDAAPYLVQWTEDTLGKIHPVYRERCDVDDIDLHTMWLTEDDLTLDTGEPLSIEEPIDAIGWPLAR